MPCAGGQPGRAKRVLVLIGDEIERTVEVGVKVECATAAQVSSGVEPSENMAVHLNPYSIHRMVAK